jgi:hypothetical protein
MSLETTYKEFVVERILKEYLKDSVIPTAEQLEEDLEEYQKVHKDLSLPLSKYVDFYVGDVGDESSAALIKTIAETVSDDVNIIIQEVYRLANDANKFYERWSFEAKRLAAKAQKLEQRTDSLLLLQNQTAGYFASVTDIFADLNLVDTDNTDAFVDVDQRIVTLNPGTEEAGTVNRIDTNELTELDVSFYTLTRRPGTSVFDMSTKNNILQAFKTEDTTWVGRVTSNEPGNMTCELKAHLSKGTNVSVSRIAIDYTGPVNPNNGVVTAMYSQDGYNWFIVPSSEATQSLNANISWTFESVDLQWVKFVFYKSGPDGGQYEYDFSCRNIAFYGLSYFQGRGNLFYSNSLSATNAQGNIVNFNLAQLEACENIPNKTDINYYLAASKDNSTWSSWVQVLPSDREGVKYPKVVNFSGATWKDNTESTAVALNSSFDKNIIVTEFDSSITVDSSTRDIIQYRFKDSSFGAVNIAIPVSQDEDPDVIGNNIVLWRNIRDHSTYPDTSLVRGVQRGWGKKEQVYYCSFEILNSDGKFFDFGDKECLINGQAVTGIIKVPQGIHKFETVSDNWFDISDNYTNTVGSGTDVLTEETLKQIDPLYPHNHKLIIEGFPYVSAFKGDKIYTGTDYSGEFYATRTSLFNIENNLITYDYFAVKGVGKNEEAATLSTFVRYDPNDSGYTNELFLAKWRAGKASNEMYKYIKLKAEFLTDSTDLTPALGSYRIKLGL